MNENDDRKNPENSGSPKRRRKLPIALFVWLGIFVAGALFFYYHSRKAEKPLEFTPKNFLEALEKQQIKSATVSPETYGFYFISGKCVSDIGNQEKSPDKTITVPSQNLQDAAYTVRIPATESLIDKLNSNPVAEVEYEEDDSWWQDILINLGLGLIILFVIIFIFTRQMNRSGGGAMSFGKSKARVIMPNELKTRFADVAGCDEAKEDTREIVEYLRDPLKFKLLGGRIPRGALLTGQPGTGKTLLAKAVAGEAGVPFFSISGSDFVEMFVGVGASRVRDMFDQARQHAPSVIFIDEIDAVGRSRFSGIGGGHDEREQTLNAMLVEMDGLETEEGAVIVLAATNRADVLDPALLRPGRFDRQIVVDLPDIRGRRQILDVHTKKIKLDPAVDLDLVAKTTPGFSGADLANLVNEAALSAARNERQAATQKDMEDARDKVCFGTERRSRKIPAHERRLTAWHEAGHTLVNLYCEFGTPLHKVTIIPRGQALGLTMMMDQQDRYSRTRGEMLDTICMSLGGRVAEELAMKDISGGAVQDISHATDIAHAMVCAFGMSEKMGPVKYGERAQHIYLGRDITRNDSISEETMREIDLEVKKILSEQKIRATKILTAHRDQLDKLAEELLEKETLDAKQIHELLDIPMPPEPVD